MRRAHPSIQWVKLKALVQVAHSLAENFEAIEPS
jgi:hypothetical protein